MAETSHRQGIGERATERACAAAAEPLAVYGHTAQAQAYAAQLTAGPRMAAQRRAVQAILGSSAAVAQRKTSIQHGTEQYSYYDHDAQERRNQTVGAEMKAWLDPKKPLKGSATGAPQAAFIQNLRRTFPNDNMIRGHLLNHDLGGYGVEQNLFPITSAANGVHLRTVEYGVKNALLQANTDGKGVYYHVRVSGDATDNKDAPVSTFECAARYLDDVEDHDNLGAEILRVNVHSTPKKSGPKREAAARGTATLPNGDAAGNFAHSSGLSSWFHGGRSGEQDFNEIIGAGTINVTAVAALADGGSIEATFLAFLDVLSLRQTFELLRAQRPETYELALTAFEAVYTSPPDSEEAVAKLAEMWDQQSQELQELQGH